MNCNHPGCQRTTQHEHTTTSAPPKLGILGIGGAVHPAYWCNGGPLDGRTLADEKGGADVPVYEGASEDWKRTGFYRLEGGCWVFVEEPRDASLDKRSGAMETHPETSAPPPHEADGGASPEVGHGDGDDVSTEWPQRWAVVVREFEMAEQARVRAGRRRLATLRAMQESGMSLRAIGEIVGMSGQRVGQLLG